jgi:hypothetical protein
MYHYRYLLFINLTSVLDLNQSHWRQGQGQDGRKVMLDGWQCQNHGQQCQSHGRQRQSWNGRKLMSKVFFFFRVLSKIEYFIMQGQMIILIVDP